MKMKTKQSTKKKTTTMTPSAGGQSTGGGAERSQKLRAVTGLSPSAENREHAWHGDEVEPADTNRRHLSETSEEAATRAEGRAPVAASEAEKFAAGTYVDRARTPRAPRPEDSVTDELKRESAVEAHAAARGGKLVRGPI